MKAFPTLLACAVAALAPAAAAQDFTGKFKLQTQFQAPENKCFEGNRYDPATGEGGGGIMVKCEWASGQYWFFTPAGDGYFTMQTDFQAPQNKCFDGNRMADGAVLGGASYMADCDGSDSQMWKFTPDGGGYYRLTTKALEGENRCLEGNRLAPGSTLEGQAFMDTCQNVTGQRWSFVDTAFVPSPEVPKDVTIGTSPYPQVSVYDLADFAWREFVALNYPADPNHRGQPLAGSSLGDAADARVWETYWHRVEMFPGSEQPVNDGGKAQVTGKPTYAYSHFALDASTFGGGPHGMVDDLWNNLDEDNELNVDEMFAHVSANPNDPDDPNGFTDENRIVYEAKMNEDGFNYILANELYKGAVRDKMVAASAADEALMAYAGTCGKAPAGIVSLPCGSDAGGEGNIEIKAAWRRLTSDEMASGRYYTNEVIRYQAIPDPNDSTKEINKWFTDTYGLIGLHIIHKTVNFPTYTFATFEHVDNIASGIGYIDEITQTGRGGGDTAGARVIITERDNPIPAAVEAVNARAQAAIAGTVWANYKLVGVQAYPVDFSTIAAATAEQTSIYYLANIVIESNEELQNFRGGKSGKQKDKLNTYVQGTGKVNMGGCLGCHGVAQLAGSDFNFLIKNSPITAPEPVGADIGIIDFVDVQNFADVQQMFQSYVALNSISINSSPHGRFWDDLDYKTFTTGDVPGVGIPIMTCGDASTSNLVEILSGGLPSGIPEMPAGGPYFPEEQIESFAKWVDAGCPQ